jgi:hypothetical protein
MSGLTLLPDRYAVVRLPAGASIPHWATMGMFSSITRTSDELSIICAEDGVPADVRAERGFRCLKVEGPLPFDLVGLAAKITSPLADAQISLMFVSTFDTDYVLVKDEKIAAAIKGLRGAGFIIT